MKKKLPKLSIVVFITPILLTLVLAGFGYVHIQDYQNTKELLSSIEKKIGIFEGNLDETLFNEHLKLNENFALTETIKQQQREIEELNAALESEDYSLIPTVYEKYQAYINNIKRHEGDGLDAEDEKSAAEVWSEMLLQQDFETLLTQIDDQNSSLETEYQEYLASLPPPAPVSTGGYNYQSITNERGTFGVYLIKESLNSVKVVTASAAGDDCKNNCPTKSLAEHVNDNGGFAGMNGTYFCPPDYGECSSKVNSFDFALYKSSSGKWLNDNALGWSETGLITFKGSNADFYKKSTDYGGGSVTAGISNYPSLLKDRNVVVNADKLTSYQRDVKGTRGAIGVGDENIYLALITNATIVDAAYVMRDLVAKHALNLDGGGSSAMYANGGYIIGPGRSLPNAVVLVK